MVMTASRSRNATRTMKKTECRQDCGAVWGEFFAICRRVLLPLIRHWLRLAHDLHGRYPLAMQVYQQYPARSGCALNEYYLSVGQPKRNPAVVSKLKRPVFLARDLSGLS